MSVEKSQLNLSEQKQKKREEDHMAFVKSIFEGPIAPVSLRLAIPVLIGNLMMLLYNIVDTIFISAIDKHSTALISGIGLIFPIYSLFMAIATSLFTGVSALVARGLGEKNNKLLDKTADSSLGLGVFITIISLVLGYIFGGKIVHSLAGSSLSQEAINNGLNYFYFLLPGLGFLLITQILSGILQGEGLTQYTAMAMLISTVLNIIFDPIFIFVFKLGVAGASLVTSLSILVGGIYLIFAIKNKSKIKINWSIRNVDWSTMGAILKIGIPQLLVMISLSFGVMFLNNVVSSISQNNMNSWTLVGRIDQILVMVGQAFANATITLVGQNYGRNNLDRVRKIFQTNIVLGLIGCAVMALIYILISRPLFSIFTSVPEVLKGCVFQVQVLSLSYLGTVAAVISIAAFQSTGKPFLGFILTFIRIFIITIPLAYLLALKFHMGINGLYLALGGVNILILFVSFIWASVHLKGLKFKTVMKETA